MKFESWNLQPCTQKKKKENKNNPQVKFLSIFEQLYCYEVTLLKKYKKPLLQKSKTKIFDQNRFHKKLVQSQREKQPGRFEIKSDNV